MSLRLRLFLFFGGLIALMVGAELWLVRGLTRDLEAEVGDVALSVGNRLLGIFGVELATQERLEGVPGVAQAAFVMKGSEGIWTDPVAFGTEGFEGERVRVVQRQALPRIEVEERWTIEGDDAVGFLLPQIFERQCENPYARVPWPEGRAPQWGEGAEARELETLIETEFAQAAEGWGVPLPFQPGEDSANAFIMHLNLADSEHVRGVDAPFGSLQVRLNTVRTERDEANDLVVFDVKEERPALRRDIAIPSEGFGSAIDTFLSRLLFGSFAILGLGLLVAGYVAHRVAVPLHGLARAAREVEEGRFGARAPEGGDPEVAETIQAFNSMSARLSELDEEARTLRDREHLTEIGEMARGLAHALRNPLNLLGLSVEELAERSDGDAGTRDLVVSVRDQIQRVDRSLRSFLALSSGGAGEVEDVLVDDVVRDVALELLQDARGAVRVEVESESGPHLLPAVAPELRAIVHVLVVNAVEASPAGALVTVRISAAERVCIEVLDEGPGIAPEVRERLFTPHCSTKEQGAGMGLFLARRIAVSRYGGSLSLEDRGLIGTVARLELSGRSTPLHG